MLCGVTVRCSFGAGDTRIANDPGESVGGGELADTAGGRMEQYAPASYNLPINWQPFPGDNARANCLHQKEQQIEPAKRLACFHSRRQVTDLCREVMPRVAHFTITGVNSHGSHDVRGKSNSSNLPPCPQLFSLTNAASRNDV